MTKKKRVLETSSINEGHAQMKAGGTVRCSVSNLDRLKRTKTVTVCVYTCSPAAVTPMF